MKSDDLKCVLLLMVGIVALNGVTSSVAEDWSTYRHDVRRSGVTKETLRFPLRQSWIMKSAVVPQTAWTGPAKWDAYSGNSGLQSMRNFDPCFYVTASQGILYYGSSADDAVHAIEIKSGTERWVYFTESAVRFPPTIAEGRVFFGSDDGFVYCCDQFTGELVWKRCACPRNRYVTSNRKIISMWPVRTGVVVEDGRAIFGGSLVPWEPSYLWKVNSQDGGTELDDCFQSTAEGVTLQGALLTSSDRIYVPQGRAAPLSFDRQDGTMEGAIGEAGGVFCVLTEDEMLLAGPQNQKSSDTQLRLADGENRERLATFSGTNRILLEGDQAWIPTGGKLKLLARSAYVDAQIKANQSLAIIEKGKRKKDEIEPSVLEKASADYKAAKSAENAAWKWEVDCPAPKGFIKAGDVIVAGLDHEVRAYSAKSGKLVWQHAVEGIAHGLAVADGHLFVSTGLGHIYAFGANN
ncbi:PQQ-binding-like beta-propeller repeat protein [Roseiconus lacunae]|uniref:PQQ-binding-like beta-propeller repeat protein n=1 Tax=Roseiconus lacunae TaxID=2605694 RepID=A0ABT7PKZ5_9BACT|nr:PQQ-binding-like beta-propeller repeat protein [Roseiconus lacunae]MDM4017174.1 PQQ-binding-like beta-propeller repeat protein [Roseiconus lacunae]